eukprot:UN29550
MLSHAQPEQQNVPQSRSARPPLLKKQTLDLNQLTSSELIDVKKEMEEQRRIYLQQHNSEGTPRSEIDPYRRAFSEMDPGNNGDLNSEEFINGLKVIGLGDQLTREQMVHTFTIIDDDDSGYIDFEEFEDFLKHRTQDEVLAKVQKHIRERIATLIMEKRTIGGRDGSSRIARTNSDSKMDSAMRAHQQKREGKSAKITRASTAKDNLPNVARDGDNAQIQILSKKIGQILIDNKTWQKAIAEIRKYIHNLELEIAKELYPVIQDKTHIEMKELVSRTLHIVDVLHGRLTSNKINSNTEATISHQAQPEDDSSEPDEYTYPDNQQSNTQQSRSERDDLEAQRAMLMQKMQERENRSEQQAYDMLHSTMSRPIIPRNKR